MLNQISETRVLGEVEKDSFIALPGKGGHSGLMPSQTRMSQLEEDNEKFYSNGSEWVWSARGLSSDGLVVR